MFHLKFKTMKTKNEMKMIALAGFMFTCLTLGISSCSDAQDQVPDRIEKGKAYTDADKMPEYPGGMAALYQFIGDNLSYPKSEENRGTEGTVHVAFAVNESGKVKDVTIDKGVNRVLDAAAMDIVKKMPDWTPGEKDGKKVSVKMVLPIKFTLGE